MSGIRVSDDVWRKFIVLRDSGFSVERAARQVGVSPASVFRQLKDPQSRLSKLLAGRGEGRVVVPLGDAAKALDDFALFRVRYLARAVVPWQVEAADRISELLRSERKEFVVVNAPPGSGKSTFFTHDLPVWLAVRDRKIRILLGSRTERQARMYTGRCRRTFEREVPVKADPRLVELGLARDAVATLKDDFGVFKPVNNDLWRAEEFVLQQTDGTAVEDKESTFSSYGMDSGFLGGRFDLVIWDDLVDKKTLRGDQESLQSWWEQEAETRVEPGGLLILQGQRMAADDLYRYALDLMDADEDDDEPAAKKYSHFLYRAHYQDKCKGHKKGEKLKAWPDSCLLDPWRLPWRELQRIRANREDRFLVMYQQEDVDPAHQLVPRLWIDGGKNAAGDLLPGCWDDDRQAGQVPKGLSGEWFSVVTADPSPSKFWSVQWWLYSPESKMQYLIDMHREPMEAPDFLDWHHTSQEFSGLLEDWWWWSYEQKRPITHVIVEQNAAQRFLLQYDHVQRWRAERSVQIIPHSTNRNKLDPDYGVQTIAPEYFFGRVRLPGSVADGARKKMEPLVHELGTWPDGKTDDCVMAHWFLAWNAPKLFQVTAKNPPAFRRPSWLEGSRW